MWFWIAAGGIAFIGLLSFSAVIVGARADRDLEQWLGERRD